MGVVSSVRETKMFPILVRLRMIIVIALIKQATMHCRVSFSTEHIIFDFLEAG